MLQGLSVFVLFFCGLAIILSWQLLLPLGSSTLAALKI